MITDIKGNLLDFNAKYIVHQVNCRGVMNSGVAKQIRQKWPQVYEDYLTVIHQLPDDISLSSLLGSLSYTEVERGKTVVNFFTQDWYGYDGKRYTNYEAFAEALTSLKEKTFPCDTIAFPYRIGCDRGGANWKIIRTMIEEILSNRNVYIVHLEDF